MKLRRLRVTDDGSHTIINKQYGETYHSDFGAITESFHVFINAGLEFVLGNNPKQINILEIGTGTGLNVFLTYLKTKDLDIQVNYTGIEPFPLSLTEAKTLNYPSLLEVDPEAFLKVHSAQGHIVKLSNKFVFTNHIVTLNKVELDIGKFDLVYMDAFSPKSQPELWTLDMFCKLYKSMSPCGVLTTYSCKGDVKRNLKKANFLIEKLPGPPGKREFLRAIVPK